MNSSIFSWSTANHFRRSIILASALLSMVSAEPMLEVHDEDGLIDSFDFEFIENHASQPVESVMIIDTAEEKTKFNWK